MEKSRWEKLAEHYARQDFGDSIASVHWSLWLLAMVPTVVAIYYIVSAKPDASVVYEHLEVVEDGETKDKLLSVDLDPSPLTLVARAVAVVWLVVLSLFFLWAASIAGGFGIY